MEAPVYNGPFDRALRAAFRAEALTLLEGGGVRVKPKRGRGGAWALVLVEGPLAAFMLGLQRSRWYEATEASALACDLHNAFTARVVPL